MKGRLKLLSGELQLAQIDSHARKQASAVLARLTEAGLLDPYEIQGYHVRGLDAVYQVVEHFGLHYGQIAYITKQVRGVDLGFYSELNKPGRAG